MLTLTVLEFKMYFFLNATGSHHSPPQDSWHSVLLPDVITGFYWQGLGTLWPKKWITSFFSPEFSWVTWISVFCACSVHIKGSRIRSVSINELYEWSNRGEREKNLKMISHSGERYWPRPCKRQVSVIFTFRKRLYTIYVKMRTNKATELTEYALESWDSQLSSAQPVGSVAF